MNRGNLLFETSGVESIVIMAKGEKTTKKKTEGGRNFLGRDGMETLGGDPQNKLIATGDRFREGSRRKCDVCREKIRPRQKRVRQESGISRKDTKRGNVTGVGDGQGRFLEKPEKGKRPKKKK